MLNPKVNDYFDHLKKWKKEQELLREIVLECGLAEEFKWKHPCYTFQKKNIVLIHGFKDYCALLFYKGAVLKDSEEILIQQTKNVQTGRQIRFTDIQEIIKLKPILKAYIFEAIEAEKAGIKVEMKKTSDFEVPKELELIFGANPDFKAAFEKLSPGRKRGYLLHFAQPKQSSTRTARIEKNTPRILSGKGLNDCICGHSKRFPNCDGSHKNYL